MVRGPITCSFGIWLGGPNLYTRVKASKQAWPKQNAKDIKWLSGLLQGLLCRVLALKRKNG